MTILHQNSCEKKEDFNAEMLFYGQHNNEQDLKVVQEIPYAERHFFQKTSLLNKIYTGNMLKAKNTNGREKGD